ncbi:MAG: hypothetical protein V4463_07525 [Pseudomonadota bacterium]
MSKLVHFDGPDAQDVQEIIKISRISDNKIKERAEEALVDYVGNQDKIRTSLALVLDMSRDVQTSNAQRHS